LFALRSDGQSITPTGGLAAKHFLLIVSHFLIGGAIAMPASHYHPVLLATEGGTTKKG
jgi:hypothetical protein